MTEVTKESSSEVSVKLESVGDVLESIENEDIVPEMMVTVQVEERDDQVLDFSSNTASKRSIKKDSQQRKKKLPETPDERKERLKRDRARKLWARQNETLEQRKARLDYHKKYKRKSRAQPKQIIPNGTNGIWKCDQCSTKFDNIGGWQKHIKTHPWKEDHSMKVRKSLHIQETQIITFPQADSEEVVVKVEPLNYDDDRMNTFKSDPIHDHKNESVQKDELPFTIQCAIVNKMFKGRSIRDICKIYKVTPDVVNELWEDRAKYEFNKLGRTQRHMNAKIEENVLQWMQDQKDNHIQISGRMIQNTAESIARDLGVYTFDGSRKWLDRFKKKHHIMFGTRNRDYRATPDNKVKTQFFVDQWAEARQGFSDEDIYVADEVGLFYNPSKNRIQKLRGKKFIQGCVKDRLSIFLCTNATGSDKKKLIVCGSEDPLLNSCRDPRTLPVLYKRHAQAHFTTSIFENYVNCWNKELKDSKKKALLILDRATIHTKLKLSNLKLLFVPYKSKNSLVPIRNGVYTRFREEFRRLILEDKVIKCMSGLDRNITCLEALEMLEKSWERIPPEVITNSLFSIGYDVAEPKGETFTPKVEQDEESMCAILKNYDVERYYTDLALLDQYLIVDEDLLTGQGTNPSVFGGNHKAIPKKEVEEHLPIGTQKPEESYVEVGVKKERVKNLEIVRKYLQSKDPSLVTYCEFMGMNTFAAQPSEFSNS